MKEWLQSLTTVEAGWIPLLVFAVLCAFTLIVGMTILRARARVRNIADVGIRQRAPRPSRFRSQLAAAIPLLPREQEHLEQDLRRAGYYSPYAAVEYLYARNFVVLGIILLGGIAAIVVDPRTSLPRTILLATLITMAVAYVLPRVLLHLQASRRLYRIQKGLPDALDIIRMCLTGGLPLRDSLERVAKEVEFFHPDVAVELEIVRRHAEADTMQKALREFARRMNAPDINALATLVSQTERTGTHVANAVTEFADSIRRQHRQRAEERAQRTSIALLFPVIFCLAPPVFILLLAPPLLQLRTFVIEANQPGGILEPNTRDIPTATAPTRPANTRENSENTAIP
ncbi:MAG: secretion protein [Planctomycetaceae bacterium]|nr:MAG: secretion protein [Planctomycetaceae bacterium]